MKKNIITIIVIIVGSIFLSLLLLKGPNLVERVNESAKVMLENMRKQKEIKKLEKKGYIVLKDGTLWYKMKEEGDMVTLISAFPLSKDGKIKEGEPYYLSYQSECEKGCNIFEKESDLISFVGETFFSNFIETVGKENSQESVVRHVTIDDLKNLGCDTDNLTCKDAPSWLTTNDFWTSITIEGTNEVFVVTKEKEMKTYPATDKATVRLVFTTNKKNVE